MMFIYVFHSNAATADTYKSTVYCTYVLHCSLYCLLQVSSVELERVVLANVPGVAEAAAVGVAAPGGGPELLHMFLVLNPSAAAAAAGKASGSSRSSAAIEAAADAVKQLQQACQAAVRAHLNPLFKVERVLLVPSLPRTASNKVMRRVLRSQAMQQRAKL
jgi:acyl-coenzyme A synthetase/AMP-(fatty) acid ligase